MQVTAGRDALPPGTRVGGWIIEQALGRDDIAVSYVARDAATKARLKVEEYLPESIARREDDNIVHPRSPALSAAFEAGRRAFLEEARQLAQPLHPALLQVIASWQSNGTAYRALPLLADEPTLDRLRRRRPRCLLKRGCARCSSRSPTRSLRCTRSRWCTATSGPATS